MCGGRSEVEILGGFALVRVGHVATRCTESGHGHILSAEVAGLLAENVEPCFYVEVVGRTFGLGSC